ncbi:MAG: class I SAM-dependent methyltransferase [Solirubrobacterales bacterium]
MSTTKPVTNKFSSLIGGPWQMTPGERVAFESLLQLVEPTLALEIGTAEGGSLARIAEHASETHSLDLVEPQPWIRDLPGVHIHTGDSHSILKPLLDSFAADGRNIDFVLVDGDHSTEGVCRDLTTLLESDAVRNTLLVLHDTMNPWVRAGIENADPDSFEKVQTFSLDFIAGGIYGGPSEEPELWGGLGVALIGETGTGVSLDTKYRGFHEILQSSIDSGIVQQDEALLKQLDAIQRSKSWRWTAPLRNVKQIFTD